MGYGDEIWHSDMIDIEVMKCHMLAPVRCKGGMDLDGEPGPNLVLAAMLGRALVTAPSGWRHVKGDCGREGLLFEQQTSWSSCAAEVRYMPADPLEYSQKQTTRSRSEWRW